MSAITPVTLPPQASSSAALEETVEFVPINSPILSQPTVDVPIDEICSPKIQKIIDKLLSKAKLAPPATPDDVISRLIGRAIRGGYLDDFVTRKEDNSSVIDRLTVEKLVAKAKQEGYLDEELANSSPLAKKEAYLALAAPQIGEPYSIIMVDSKVHINPSIEWSSSEVERSVETCLSLDPQIHGVVPRADCVAIMAYDREGNFAEHDFVGSMARMVQHAIDHLHGKTFLERVETTHEDMNN